VPKVPGAGSWAPGRQSPGLVFEGRSGEVVVCWVMARGAAGGPGSRGME
jgi:hypothetical protein